MSEENIETTETQEEPEVIDEEEVVNENDEETQQNEEEDESSEVREESDEDAGKESVEENAKADEKYSVKIDGEEVELTIDQMKALASKASGAEKRFQEAFHARENIQKAFNELKENPFSAMEKVGLDPRKAAEEYLLDIIQKEEMTEEQKALYEAQQKLKNYEKKEQDAVKTKEEQEMIALKEQLTADYDKQFTEALETVEVPKTPNTIARMASYMEQALAEGVELDAKTAAKLVKEDISGGTKEVLSKMELDKAVEFLGEELVNKIKNYDATKVKSPTDGNKVNKDTHSKPKRKSSKKRTWAEMQKELNEKFGDPYTA